MLELLHKHMPAKTLWHFDGREVRTPRTLLNLGIAHCSHCGTTMETQKMGGWWCHRCSSIQLAIADDMHAPFISANMPLLQQKIKDVKPENICPVCLGHKRGKNSAMCAKCKGQKLSKQYSKPKTHKP